MKNKFQRFIESECERQWNECQAKDGFGFGMSRQMIQRQSFIIACMNI